MPDQIVMTEKASQTKGVRAAVGSRYGSVLAAEGHLVDLLEPGDVAPAWKQWTSILLRPDGLFSTHPASGGNKAVKLKAVHDALRTAKRVWLATDCDREGQLIGQEILEHYQYRGEVLRVLFTAQDPQTIRDAFGRAKPNGEYAHLYAAAVTCRQADQIYNLSLTGTARPRKLSLKRRYYLTHSTMISRSKWRPSNSSFKHRSPAISAPSIRQGGEDGEACKLHRSPSRPLHRDNKRPAAETALSRDFRPAFDIVRSSHRIGAR